MKSIEDFKNHFTNEIAPKLDDLEKKRKNAKNAIVSTFVVVGIVIIHAILYYGLDVKLFDFIKKSEPNTMFLYHFIVLIGTVIILAIFLKLSSFKKEYKEKIIRPVIDYISPDFTYDPKKHVSREHIDESKTIINKFNQFTGDDFVSGTIHNHPFEISEIKAEYKTNHKKDNDTHTIFHGLFFHSTIKKKFDGYVLLQPYIPRILQGLKGNKVKSDVVNLSDMTISEKFVCYSNDDINARKILTPKLIELINKFSENHKKRPLAISIINDKLYVAIDYRQNLFEPKYFTSVKDPKHPLDYYSMLVMITNILDDLDLAD